MTEEKTLEILVDFVNALEAAAVNLKHAVAEIVGIEEKSHPLLWNASKIAWTRVQGSKGPYLRSEDIDNAEFKIMLEDLKTHSGKLSHDGYFFWLFPNGVTIGRKKSS